MTCQGQTGFSWSWSQKDEACQLTGGGLFQEVGAVQLYQSWNAFSLKKIKHRVFTLSGQASESRTLLCSPCLQSPPACSSPALQKCNSAKGPLHNLARPCMTLHNLAQSRKRTFAHLLKQGPGSVKVASIGLQHAPGLPDVGMPRVCQGPLLKQGPCLTLIPGCQLQPCPGLQASTNNLACFLALAMLACRIRQCSSTLPCRSKYLQYQGGSQQQHQPAMPGHK